MPVRRFHRQGHRHDARASLAALVALALSALWLFAAVPPATAATAMPNADPVDAALTRTPPPTPPVVETIRATTDAAVARVASTASTAVAGASQTSTSVAKTVETAAAPVVDTARRAVAPVAKTVETTAAPVVDAADRTVAPVADVARRTVAPVVDQAVKPVIAPLVGDVDKVVRPVAGGVDKVTTPVSPDSVSDGRSEPGAPAPSAVSELPALAGVDPVAPARETASPGRASIELPTAAARSRDRSSSAARPGVAFAPAPVTGRAPLTPDAVVPTRSTATARTGDTPAPTAPQGPGGPTRSPVGVSAGAGSSSSALGLAALGALVASTLCAAPCAIRRLCLAAARWRPAAFLSLLERPG